MAWPTSRPGAPIATWRTGSTGSPRAHLPSELLYRILELLFSEREAGLVARLPIRPFTAATASRAWGTSEAEARRVLDGLASRAVLLDMEGPDGTVYVLPPPMAGFFEFSMMRVSDDIDQHLLSELFYEYITVEDEFILNLFTHGRTQLGRVFVNEPALAESAGRAATAASAAGRAATAGSAPGPAERADGGLHVLDYERASEVIATARHMGVGACYCRHKMEHLGRACGAPMGICMTFGGTADSLIRHGYARRVDAGRGHGPARRGLRGQPRAVRRERAARGQLHLQLLRLLLRGDDRGAPLRDARSRAHDQLPAPRRRRALQRLRQVRRRLSRGGDDARLRERSRQAEEAPRRPRRRDLPRLRRLHSRLPDERALAPGTCRAGGHSRRHRCIEPS